MAAEVANETTEPKWLAGYYLLGSNDMLRLTTDDTANQANLITRIEVLWCNIMMMSTAATTV
jgi:hypothetical protein